MPVPWRITISARGDTSGEIQFIELAMLGLIEALLGDQNIQARFAPLYQRQHYQHAMRYFRDQHWRVAMNREEVCLLTPVFHATAREVISDLFGVPVTWLEPLLGSCAMLTPVASLIPGSLTITCHHTPEPRQFDFVFDGLEEAALRTCCPPANKPGRAPRAKDAEAYTRFGVWYVRHVLHRIPINQLEEDYEQECSDKRLQPTIQNGIDRIADLLHLPSRPRRLGN